MLPIGSTLEQKRFPRATVALVMVNFVMFSFQILFSPYLIEEQKHVLTYGTGSLNLVALFTSIFLHGSCDHVFFNNLFLWAFGPPVEDRVGSKLFLVYYIGAGVAANVFEVIVDVIHAPTAMTHGLGASGAISGIMALFLYRCWHSKMKMFIPVLFLPVTVRIPAVPLMVLFFVKEIISGISSFSNPTNIAHWAHVGGFLFGLAVGRIKRYGHEAAMEKYDGAVMDTLRSGGGWDGLKDESALVKLLELSPNDPERHLHLAQYYAAKGEQGKARDFYRQAVLKYFVRNPFYGACTLHEMMDAGVGTMQLHHHLRAAEELAGGGFPDEAYRVIKPAVEDGVSGVLAERAHILYLKLCRDLYKDKELVAGIEVFGKRYPGSAREKEVGDIVKLKPGAIFLKRKIAMPESAQKVFEEPEQITKREYGLAKFFNEFFEIFNDARFFWLFVAMLPLTLLISWYGLFFIVFIATALSRALSRVEWGKLLWGARVNEERQRRDADAATLYNRALLADRGENYQKAAELYEKFLAIDAANVQARFNLARIYHMKLKDRNNALRQYGRLLDILPQDHPYRHETEEAIKTGCK